uniref:Viral coat protein n=1 Tax=Qianjiang dicistro-like virus 57 TaxID=3239335 RepID=A0AB39JDF6_9VIRU
MGVADINNEACTRVSVGVTKDTHLQPAEPSYQDLKDYFARPRLVASGNVPATRGNFVVANVTFANLFSNWFPQGLSRLGGVHGIRFTLRFTLTTASTPFQQGLIASAFQYAIVNNDAMTYPRHLNPALVTNLPHVRHDLAETTMSQLDVPFLSAYDFYPLYTYPDSTPLLSGSTQCLGIYTINMLLPYRTLSNTTFPTYKLLVSMHDLDFIGSAPLNSLSFTPQSGNVVQRELDATKPSGYLSRSASAVRTVTRHVPMLSSVGGTTAAVLDDLANVAKSFGFAKPQVEDYPKRVHRVDSIAEGNIDVPSDALVLAPFQANRLAVDALAGGTDVDEMSLAYILSRYCQIFVGSIGTTDATGTSIYGTPVCPTSFWFRTNNSRPGGNLPYPASSTLTTNCIAPSALCYLGTHFRFWKGGIKFRFTFSKTKLHGGRVIIGFVPKLTDVVTNDPISPLIPSIEIAAGLPQPFSYCKVFDLKDASQVELEVPYVSHLPYSDVFGSIGGVTMTVLDPLVSSGETATIIDFMVEVAAMDDFEFSAPTGARVIPSKPTGSVFLQSGANAGVGITRVDGDQYTVGETIRSVKQLAMLPDYYAFITQPETLTQINLPHWFVGYSYDNGTPMPPQGPRAFNASKSSNIAAMYAFVTGSTNHHLYGDSVGGSYSIAAITSQFPFIDAPATNADVRAGNLNGEARIFSQDKALHVRVPSFQRVARIPLNFSTLFPHNNKQLPTLYPDTSPAASRIAFARCGAGATVVKFIVGRAAADDARGVAYIGPPPVILWPSTQDYIFENTPPY